MPILAAGNRRAPARDAGFSLVELLAVLAILSLMVGAVVMNLPQPRSETDRASEAMTAQLAHFVDDGAVTGEMRALGADVDGIILYAHDGLVWQERARIDWPDAARPRIERGEDVVRLTEAASPLLLFEPYGAVPDFTIRLSAPDGRYRLSADERGRIVRSVER